MENLINNYYVLKRVAEELKRLISGWSLQEAYSTGKGTVILHFVDGKEQFTAACYLKPPDPFLYFPENFQKPKKRVIPQFKSLAGLVVEDVYTHRQDRSICLRFHGENSLVFKLYGRHGNIIHFEGEQPVEMFRNQFRNDRQKLLADYNRDIELSRELFVKMADKQHFMNLLKTYYPSFSSDFFVQLEKMNFSESEPEKQWQKLNRFLQYLEQPLFYILRQPATAADDPGIRLSILKGGEIEFQSSNVIDALNHFAAEYLYEHKLLHEKSSLLDKLREQRKRLQKQHDSANIKLKKLKERRNYREMGDLLMANLQQIPREQGRSNFLISIGMNQPIFP